MCPAGRVRIQRMGARDMRIASLLRAGCALVLMNLAGATALSAQAPTEPAARIARWNEDLDFFSALVQGRGIPGNRRMPGQKNFRKLYPHFVEDLEALRSQVPDLNDGTISWRLARLWSGPNIAHNSLVPGDSMYLAIGVQWLAEGPVVAYATSDYRSLLGAPLLRIGGLDAGEFLERLSPYVAYETEGWRRVIAEVAMTRRALLRDLQLVQEDKVLLTVDTPWGAREVEVGFVTRGTPQIGLREAFGLPVPVAASQPDQQYYWRRYLPEARTLYIQYSRCADDPALSFKDFAAQVGEEIDARRPARVVVDLRFNGGGNNRIVTPLIKELAARRTLTGRPVVLIGPHTFSSGVNAAHDLRRKTGALLVGASTGGLYGGYGNAPAIALPNSGLGVQWTLNRYFYWSGKPEEPDMAVPVTAQDLRSGRDAVLEIALAADPKTR